MICLVCGAETEKTDYKYTYTSEAFKQLFPTVNICYCKHCELFQADIENSRDNEEKLSSYYRDSYRDASNTLFSRQPKLTEKNNILYARGKGISNLIRKHMKCSTEGMRIFEKGSGLGFNLMHMKKIYPNAALYTDELDSHSADYNRELGIVVKSPNSEVDEFDCIIMSHVLEHLTNPLDEILLMHKELKQSGVLYIEVPNSLNYIEPHVTFWTPDSFMIFYNNYLKDKFELLEYQTTGCPHCYQGRGLVFRLFWKCVKKIVPGHLLYSVRIKNGVYLRALLKKK